MCVCLSVCQKKYFNLIWLELHWVYTWDKKDKTVHVNSVLQTWKQANNENDLPPPPTHEALCPVLTPKISSLINYKLPDNGLAWEPQHRRTLTGNAVKKNKKNKDVFGIAQVQRRRKDDNLMQVWISVSEPTDPEHNVYLLLVTPTSPKIKWLTMGRGNCVCQVFYHAA